ncbi:DNA-binding protein [Flagelloscypha sp. PMI_526]|nr:DNA-binding protein [Flagelloscypha sp. PMI_526]
MRLSLLLPEFIEVAIHLILFIRQVYPAKAFVRRLKYNTPVWQTTHPQIQDYIKEALVAFGEELARSNIQRLILVIKDGRTQVPYERFIFGMQRVVDVNEDNKHLGVRGGMTPEALSQYFRSFIVKLSMMEGTLGETELGEDITFAILMELKTKLPEPLEEDEIQVEHEGEGSEGEHIDRGCQAEASPPWLPADIEHSSTGASADAELHMVRAVDTGIINLAMAVQESDAKLNPAKYRRRAKPQPKSDEESGTISQDIPTADTSQPLLATATSGPGNIQEQPANIERVHPSDLEAVNGDESSASTVSTRRRKGVSFQLPNESGEQVVISLTQPTTSQPAGETKPGGPG